MMWMKKCPKCDQGNVNVVKEGLIAGFRRNLLNVAIPIRLFMGYAKKPKSLNVCQNPECGFDWVDL